MIQPSQLRAARALLDWPRSKLAKESSVSAETVKNIETGKFVPHQNTVNAICVTLQMNNVVLTENSGVRFADVENIGISLS